MPAFGTLSPPPGLYQGDSYKVWNNESVVNGSVSQEVALAMIPGATGQTLSVEIVFSADPGVFELDLLTSDTDTQNDFQKKSSVAAVVNNVARMEVPNVRANFAALSFAALGNNVNATAKITLG